MEHHQLDLFAENPVQPSSTKPQTLSMDATALGRWKSEIAVYQQQVRESQPPPLQTTLFEIAQVHCDPETIDPLTLRLQAMSFYRLPADSPGDSCLYFVVDSAARLILYVGETCRSNKRWKGLHDCKGYIESYQDLHYRYGLQTAVNIAFWWDTPAFRRLRQELELSLILKWRSPFNKENWQRWGQPFG